MAEVKKKKVVVASSVSSADMFFAKCMVRLYTSDRLAFYYKLGAKNRDDFFHLRVDGKELENLANLLKIK